MRVDLWGFRFVPDRLVSRRSPFFVSGVLVSGSLSPSPWLTILDGNGRPVSGAKLYTYLSGTSTPSTVYQDSSLATPHSFPAIADAAGRITVYLPAQSTLKFVVKTAGDVLIRETDPVTSVDLSASLIDALAQLREAFISWPGSDSAALLGVDIPHGALNNARAPGTAIFVITETVTVNFEATLWVEAGGTAIVELYAISDPDNVIAGSTLSSTNADGEHKQSGDVLLTPGSYIIKGFSSSLTAQAYAVGYRIIPV